MNEIFSKIDNYFKQISEYRPFSDQNLLKQIKNFYRIDCTWSSNAIEGNSYTLSETKILLEDGLTAGGKTLKEALETVNHAKSFDYMFSLLTKKFLTEENIILMHSLLADSLENDTVAGKYRKIPVFITGSQFQTAEVGSITSLMNKLIKSQNTLFKNYHPIKAVAKFHKEFVFIHPFADGNGRIARLAMNCLLIQRGYLPISIPPIIRTDYIRSLEKAHKNDNDFISLIARMELETQKDFIRMIKGFSEREYNDEDDQNK